MATIDIYLHGTKPSYRDGRVADLVKVRVPEGAELLETRGAPTSLFVPDPSCPGLRVAMPARDAFERALAERDGFDVASVRTAAMRKATPA